jgi:transcriptional regulator with XRE-family HTH domain
MNLAQKIAHRVKQARHERGWSLDELAERSKVSRAMISKIERQVSTPTAVLLARLADAFGSSLSSLIFEPPADLQAVTRGEVQTTGPSVTRLIDQAQWVDPASGYTRRLLSAAAHAGDVEIVAVELPAGARVQFAAAASHHITGRLVLLSGQLHVRVGGEPLGLQPGDCAVLALHRQHELINPGAQPARYLVVMQRLPVQARTEPESS